MARLPKPPAALLRTTGNAPHSAAKLLATLHNPSGFSVLYEWPIVLVTTTTFVLCRTWVSFVVRFLHQGYGARRSSHRRTLISRIEFICCDQSAVAVRFGALLASSQFALFSRSSTASGTGDSKYLCWARFCFHREIMPKTHGQEMVNLEHSV